MKNIEKGWISVEGSRIGQRENLNCDTSTNAADFTSAFEAHMAHERCLMVGLNGMSCDHSGPGGCHRGSVL